jgi:hypothetical protein
MWFQRTHPFSPWFGKTVGTCLLLAVAYAVAVREQSSAALVLSLAALMCLAVVDGILWLSIYPVDVATKN